MKIAIFTDTFLPEINGVTKTLSKMRNYMDNKGIEYKFFVPGDEAQKKDNIVSFNSFKFFLYPERKIAIPRYREIKDNLDEFNPDIIFIVTPFAIGLMGLRYAKENGLPMVSNYSTDFPKYLRHYKLEILENALWTFFKWFHSYSYINLCPSTVTKLDMETHGIQNVELWSRGIETGEFSPQKRSEELRKQYCSDNNEKILLYVGRVAPEKELSVLMDSAKLLNKKNLRFKLLVIGDGPSKQEFENENIKNVVFVGYKTGDELKSYYASADIFTFPSSSETYGNVILEAMASGLPVVAPFAGGIRENLIDMENGIAFSSGDSQAMADKIEKIINNEELKNNLSKNAREHTLSKSWNEIYSNLFRRFREVINLYNLRFTKTSA